MLSLNILECHIKLHRICTSLYAVIPSSAYWSLWFQKTSLHYWIFHENITFKGTSELPNIDSMCANIWDIAFIIYMHFHTALLTSLICCFQCAWLVYLRDFPEKLFISSTNNCPSNFHACCILIKAKPYAAALRQEEAKVGLCVINSQNHRITEWLSWEGVFGDCLVQLPAQSRVTYSRLLRLCPVGFWVSSRMKTPQPLLGNLYQCLTTISIKKG